MGRFRVMYEAPDRPGLIGSEVVEARSSAEAADRVRERGDHTLAVLPLIDIEALPAANAQPPRDTSR